MVVWGHSGFRACTLLFWAVKYVLRSPLPSLAAGATPRAPTDSKPGIPNTRCKTMEARCQTLGATQILDFGHDPLKVIQTKNAQIPPIGPLWKA